MTKNASSRNPRGESTEQRILDAAELTFARRGYGAASLRDIAAAAGVQQPGLYHYFASKEVLYSAVLNRACSPMLDWIDAFIREPRRAGSDPEVTSAVLDLIAEHPNLSALIYRALLSDDEVGLTIVLHWLELLWKRADPVARGMNPSMSDGHGYLVRIVLTHLSYGFFLLAPALARIYATGPDVPDLKASWKKVLSTVQASLLSEPFETPPLLETVAATKRKKPRAGAAAGSKKGGRQPASKARSPATAKPYQG